MSLFDVETSAEAIEEDEALIEAVGQLVETAAVAVYTDIKRDVDTFVSRVTNIIETLVPFLVRWRQDEAMFWEDLQKIAIYCGLFAIAFVVLAPFPRRSKHAKKSSSWLSFAGFIGSRSASFDSGSLNYCRSQSAPVKDGGGVQQQRKERRYSASSINQASTGSGAACFLDEEEESEEEKFSKMWPSILETQYCRLVLPPACKLVEKPKHAPKKEEKNPKKEAKDDQYDDDHPLNRLMSYMRNIVHLGMSFLRYDYVGAWSTLIHWIQACLRTRQYQNNRPDEDDDDESDAGSVSGSVRGGSVSSQLSAAHPSPNTRPTPPKHGARSKRDLMPDRKHRQKDASSNEGPEEGETIDTQDSSVVSAFTIEPSMTDESSSSGEEKKESPSEHDDSDTQPPQTPPHSPLHASTPSSSLGTGSFINDLNGSERLATKVALNPRRPLLAGPKAKDALENYRSAPARKGPPLLPSFPSHWSPSTAELESERLSLHHDVSHLRRPSGNSYFFETAETQESMNKMSVEVPVPDRNGYILGDEFLPGNEFTPLLVFVNSRSGPQQGHLLITQLRGLLNPIQVWDLADGGPETVLESFTVFTRVRILVCGGDGTVSWIVSAIENMNLQRWPPIAILPLGTGNDLARIHGWGGGYNNESLIGILEQVTEGYISWLDRWEMTVENKKGKVKEVKSFFNYLGVGADAQAALQVHMLRESRPQLFFSRVVNKAWYAIFGAEDIIKATMLNLQNDITLIADGVEIPLPADSQGIILLNIDSYSGGVPLWSHGTEERSVGGRQGSNEFPRRRSRSLGEIRGLEGRKRAYSMDRVDSEQDLASMVMTDEEKFKKVTACDRPTSCQDGLLDIVSIRGIFHLGQIRVGLSNAQKLCQCREATIIIKRKMSIQTDGEPWRENVCTLRVKRKKDAAIMLHRSADESNGVETEMAKLLDWAEDRSFIDNKVHAVLMKEFSRRIESKTRKRRVIRSQDNLMFSLKRAMGSSGNFNQGGAPVGNIMF